MIKWHNFWNICYGCSNKLEQLSGKSSFSKKKKKKKKWKKLKVSIKYLDRQSSVIFQNPTAEYGPRNRLTETDSWRSCPVRFLSLSRCIQNQKSHPPTVQNLTGSTLLLSAPNSQNPKKKKKILACCHGYAARWSRSNLFLRARP